MKIETFLWHDFVSVNGYLRSISVPSCSLIALIALIGIFFWNIAFIWLTSIVYVYLIWFNSILYCNTVFDIYIYSSNLAIQLSYLIWSGIFSSLSFLFDAIIFSNVCFDGFSSSQWIYMFDKKLFAHLFLCWLQSLLCRILCKYPIQIYE